ncbi:unnamed protein product [Rotaria sordida]|uniref:Nucleotidyltransferase n=1 Tax=Rotaria sordida TaxID=392033 RepID=A0A819KQB5_9BILA|nr:unnamed protein product [Rotaria sordida]
MEYFPTGSLIEGQTHSRHLNNEPIPDFDIMVPYSETDEKDKLINATLAPDFVTIAEPYCRIKIETVEHSASIETHHIIRPTFVTE